MNRFIKKIFRSRRPSTANIAKERLQIIISHERSQSKDPDYLMQLQKDIVDVIAKYIDIDPSQVKVQLDHRGENAVLELNVTMPEDALATT